MTIVTRAAAAALRALMLIAPLSASASTFTTLYSPAGTGDGAGPRAGLTLVRGKPYGITPYGGATGNGAIFSVDATIGAEEVLYSFPGGIEGSTPLASMLDVGGVLYGTASAGGETQNGTVFKFDIATGTATTLHRFTGADGSIPAAALIKVGALLYGTTLYGGSAGNGTVFSVDPASGTETVLHSFTGGTDGANPYAGLVQVGGRLYGVTQYGGAAGGGVLFTIDPKSGAEAVVHNFVGGNDGESPQADMIDVAGTLYGTTPYGGI